jgi:ribosome-associated translation inhibitor RaiA
MVMGRPELSRSGHTSLGEHGIRNQVDAPAAQDRDSAGHVPPGNRRPTRPGSEPESAGESGGDDDDPERLPLKDLKAAQGSASVHAQLRVGAGFTEEERPAIVSRLASLDARLSRFAAVDVDMELSIKDRDRAGQKVTLECWIARRARIVATSYLPDHEAALNEVRDDLRRQINDATTKSEPRNNRQRRESMRRSSDDGAGEPPDDRHQG